MEARILSVSEPLNASTGRIWLKPGVGAFMKLGETWVPLFSPIDDYGLTDTEDLSSYTKVIVDFVDRSLLLEKGSLVINDILTEQVNTASFLLYDIENQLELEPGQEVYIFNKQECEDEAELLFAGRIDQIPQELFSPNSPCSSDPEYSYEVSASDFTQDLNRNLVEEVYENMTEGEIIRDFISLYAPGLGAAAFVDEGNSVDRIIFNNKFPLQCLQDMTSRFNKSFYVDYERNIHYFTNETNSAPYELTQDQSSWQYAGLVINIDKSQLVNRQKVKGGFEITTSPYTQTRVADGEQTSWNLDYSPISPIEVYVNSVQKTLGIDNIDSSGFDFVYNDAEKVIKNLDLATLSSGDTIQIIYNFKKAIVADVVDQDSINAIIQIEGGDGVYEGDLIVNNDLETKAEARELASSETRLKANPLINGSFMTDYKGFKSGQLLNVNISSRGYINRQFLIQSVTYTSYGLGRFDISVRFATRLKGITEFMIQLYDRSRERFTRTDEIIDLLRTFSGDDIGIIEDSIAYNLRDPFTNPYEYNESVARYNLVSYG